MSNPANWFEIYVEDMTRAKAFYESVFGVQLTKLEGTRLEMWAFPMDQEAYGASGALVRAPDHPPGGNGSVVYFRCADCAIETAKAINSGGNIEEGKKSIGQYGYIALIIDTEGNLIGLHSMQ